MKTLSEKEILDQYWAHWFLNMIEAKRPDYELIIRECIEISQLGSISESKLKKHFGVEE